MVTAIELIQMKTEATRRRKIVTAAKAKHNKKFTVKTLKKIGKGVGKVVKIGVNVEKNVERIARPLTQGKVINKKIMRKGPRPTLDLRRRPEREGTVKQHGFKEGEIGHGNLL